MRYTILKKDKNLYNFIKKDKNKLTKAGVDIIGAKNDIIDSDNTTKISFTNFKTCESFFGAEPDFAMMVEDELPFPKIINKNNLFMDTSNITNFDYFCQLYKIEEFTPEIDYSAALTMNSAFSGCSHLKRIHRINSMNCKNFNECFLRCNKLKELVIDTDCGENYNQMLRACTELENIKFTHLTKGKNFYSMFEYCSLLKTIDLKGETINGTCFDTMFASCSSLQEVVGLDVQSAVPGSYSQSESPSLRGIFYKCSSLKKLDIRNVKKSLDLRDCPLLTEESILNISKELHTVPDDFKGHDKINIYFNDNNRIKNYLNNTYCRIINSTDSKKPIELVEKDTDSAISLADYIKNEGDYITHLQIMIKITESSLIDCSLFLCYN